MGRVNFTTEQIMLKLKDIDLSCSQGRSISEAARQSSISEQTYYRWRKAYGPAGARDARHMKELEHENSRLKSIVADLSLENAILKEDTNP
jgi:putative transposase